jgi:hypothetical protein
VLTTPKPATAVPRTDPITFFAGQALDLEGLWQANEAEGGARLFLGPSMDLTPPAHDWSLHLTAGADSRVLTKYNVTDQSGKDSP